MQHKAFYIYIITNPSLTVLYTGVTNSIEDRILEHYHNRGNSKTFAGKYYCYNLLYYETYKYVNSAIAREKEIKGWNKNKKLELIKTINPDLNFLNADFFGTWPPPADWGMRDSYEK